MNPKDRYRLQMKLQAALCHVVEILARFQQQGVNPNVHTIMLGAGVSDILKALLNNDRVVAEDFDPVIVALAMKAKSRRALATKKSKQRRRAAAIKSDTPEPVVYW